MKYIFIILIALTLFVSCERSINAEHSKITFKPYFDSAKALSYVKTQTSMGSRHYGSEAHKKVKVFIKDEIESFGYEALSHNFDATYIKGRSGENIYAFLKGQSDKYIVIASHYDSRSIAEKDKDYSMRDKPIVGANDGASSTATLLELMRALKEYENELPYSVAFVFFDLEDDGGMIEIEGSVSNILITDWIQGSIAFENENIIPKEKIYFGILLDMVGSPDAKFMFESYAYTKYSSLYNNVWSLAQKLGYGNYFHNSHYGFIVDDHTPFIENDIPFIDIIDMGYKYHHTQEDSYDKIDAKTLGAVGVLIEYLLTNPNGVY